MELKLRLPQVAVEAVAAQAVVAVADLFRPRMRACLACLLVVAYVLSRLHCAKWGVNAIGNRFPPPFSPLLCTLFAFFWPV